MGVVAAGRAEDCVGTLRAEIDSNKRAVGWPVFSGAMVDIWLTVFPRVVGCPTQAGTDVFACILIDVLACSTGVSAC